MLTFFLDAAVSVGILTLMDDAVDARRRVAAQHGTDVSVCRVHLIHLGFDLINIVSDTGRCQRQRRVRMLFRQRW